MTCYTSSQLVVHAFFRHVLKMPNTPCPLQGTSDGLANEVHSEQV
jgi:hypothetical protein